MKKWENFSKEEIEEIATSVCTYSEFGNRLGYTGSTRFQVVRDIVSKFNLDVSHFCNPRKGKFDYSRFVYGKEIDGGRASKALIALRGHKCEHCGLEEWFGEPVALEMHHIDGDRLNNVLENLQLLCPNCHSLTLNWKGRNSKRKAQEYITDEEIIIALQNNKNIRQALQDVGLSDHGSSYSRIKKIAEQNNIELKIDKNKSYNYCIDCGKEIIPRGTRCGKCHREFIKQRGIERLPVSRDELKNMIRNTSFVQIGKYFDISDNAIRKWCKKLNLPHKTSEIKKYSDIEWASI